MATKSAAPGELGGDNRVGEINEGNGAIVPDSTDSRADDFASLVPRRAPLPIATPGELADRFQRIDRRRWRAWRPCAGCETPIAEPAVVCDACAAWSALSAELARMCPRVRP